MKYKEGDYVRVTFLGTIVGVDEDDKEVPYQIECFDEVLLWFGEEDIESVPSPTFSVGEKINDGFGKTGLVNGVNYVPRNQSYQYKVNGVWFNEQELLEANK